MNCPHPFWIKIGGERGFWICEICEATPDRDTLKLLNERQSRALTIEELSRDHPTYEPERSDFWFDG